MTCPRSTRSENSIWHGFVKSEEKWVIELRVTRNNRQLNYSIRDNGIGRKEATKRKSAVSVQPDHGPQGIKNTGRRIDLLNAENEVRSSMEITDLETGTLGEITLPSKEFRHNDKDYYCG
ncbi:MAG: hypothetical protein ABI151_02235 [Chitinophagaceae bacterium]